MPPKKRFYIFIPLALLVIASLSLTRCTTLREFLGFGFTKPQITLKDLELKNISLTSIDMNVRLLVKNPNNFDIILKRMDYNVTVAGLLIADGVHEKTVTILKERDNDVRLPLKVDKQNIINIVTRILENPDQEMVAVMNAKVLFDSPVGEIEHVFTDDKKIGGSKQK